MVAEQTKIEEIHVDCFGECYPLCIVTAYMPIDVSLRGDTLPIGNSVVSCHYKTTKHAKSESYPNIMIPIVFNPEKYEVVCTYREPSGKRYRNIKYLRHILINEITNIYRVEGSCMVKRTSDNKPINVTSVSFSSSIDDWCWSVNLDIADEASFNLIKDVSNPVEIEANISGYIFRAYIEQWSNRKQFGEEGFTASGRSPSAELDIPWHQAISFMNDESTTAVAIANSLFEFTGWTVNWMAQDWVIAPNAFSVTDTSPIRALIRLAESVGAVVQTDRQNKTLLVIPRYKYPGWKLWNYDPDYYLTEDIMFSLSSESRRTYEYNAVWVISDHENGLILNAKIQGTAGDKVAPQVNELALTDVDGARARAIYELSKGGAWENIEFVCPVYPQGQGIPELCLPGDFIELRLPDAYRRGFVTDVEITASWDEDEGLVVGQTVTAEVKQNA